MENSMFARGRLGVMLGKESRKIEIAAMKAQRMKGATLTANPCIHVKGIPLTIVRHLAKATL
jgi:hypothetical protein